MAGWEKAREVVNLLLRAPGKETLDGNFLSQSNGFMNEMAAWTKSILVSAPPL